MPVSQRDRVYSMLRDWTCGTTFLERHIPRFSARIFDLQREGYTVEKRQCQSHRHTSTQYEWRLEGAGAVASVLASAVPAPPSGGEQHLRAPHEVIGSQAPLFAVATPRKAYHP